MGWESRLLRGHETRRREYLEEGSSELAAECRVVFNQTVQLLVCVFTNKNVPSRVLPENVRVQFEKWTLC